MLCRRCFAGCVAVLQVLAVSAAAQVSFEARLVDGQPPAVSAHRSAYMAGFPENSLAWIDYGIDRGVDILHINAQVTADGRYILMHDHTLNRTTDVERVYPDGAPGGPTREQRWGKDYVRDYALADLKELQIVNGKDAGTHVIPTLGEALDLVDRRALVLIGLKAYEIDSLAAALKGRETSNLMLFELFASDTDQSKLRTLSEATGIGVSVALLGPKDPIEDLIDIAAQLGASLRMVSVGGSDLTPEFLSQADEMGLHVMASGWSGPEDYALLNKSDPSRWEAILARGFTVSTDQPDLVLKLLDR